MNMEGCVGAFFVKEGPREVDFDMERVFLHSSGVGRGALHSDGIKELLDEKLLKLDDSLKERHVELVNYLREVDVRISRVENEIRHGLESSQDSGRSRLSFFEGAAPLAQSSDKAESELSEFLLRKESNLPNIAIDQEELDALLEGLNDITKDSNEILSGSDLGKDLNEDVSVGELSNMEFDESSVEAECNGSLKEESDFGNNQESEESTEPLDINFDSRNEENLLEEASSFVLPSVSESNDSRFGEETGDNVGYLGSLGVVENQEGDVKDLDFYLNESLKEDEVAFPEKDLKLLGNEEHEGGERECNPAGVSVDLEGGINDCESILNGECENVSGQKQKGGVFSDFKELDDFEDVLKTDLDCSNLQNCIGDFEEGNLYNSRLENLGERLGQNEELDLHPNIQTRGGLGDDSSSFSFTEVEKVINKFDDDAYLSKLELSSEERSVLIKFIDKLEGDLAVDSRKGGNFKSRREYEILQKIKRLLVRE
ncbi:hypothetical protein [Borrelia sp. P9F1]|uniref:hypothetical protein n=1 Tax=Borrelia sp. P9F1 TaxID=3058374 RepID=UPI0026493249|nr:hypothetical protein [Borrelia sp. P9F1]WKC58283.1 hypothetical protein QYZ68_03880 [Borrelia sp. P9F1]